MNKQKLTSFFDKVAGNRSHWRKKNSYYHKSLENFFKFRFSSECSVLEAGCSTGDMLGKLNSASKAGFDISAEMIKIARKKNPEISFYNDDIEELSLLEKFDVIILQDIVGLLKDVLKAFGNLHKVSHKGTRILLTYYNQLWEPVIVLAEKLGLKMSQPPQNWLDMNDLENLFFLSDFEVVEKGRFFLFPKYIPFISDFVNKLAVKCSLLNKFCLVTYIEARPLPRPVRKEFSCSVVIPCRNEAGNIENAVKQTPELGKGSELIFVDGNSTDGTVEKIKEMITQHPDKDIKLIHQGAGTGKGDAVRKAFDAASGEILMILDSDLTVLPEDLDKFYDAIASGKGDFINGSRLVYPMEKQAMRFLNYLGNKFFSFIFTWILGQRINDTLCGTKVLFKKDYERIKEGRKYFGEFDPFGDFDLLFGAARLGLKITELPVRYRARTYGDTKISRFTHGLLLLKMSIIAFIKFKLKVNNNAAKRN
ncbi:MAG: glycosyltransferase [Candidatus Omnitrophota bacterium]|nr:glycosyltransferase [Candidatus Omnitrophota bacterium]MBU4122777.1 glycosyltransferase [bacterium]